MYPCAYLYYQETEPQDWSSMHILHFLILKFVHIKGKCEKKCPLHSEVRTVQDIGKNFAALTTDVDSQ